MVENYHWDCKKINYDKLSEYVINLDDNDDFN